MRIISEPTPPDCTQPILQSAMFELRKLWFENLIQNSKDTGDKDK